MYLGCTLSTSNDEIKKIWSRLVAGNRTLTTAMKSCNVHRKTKLQLCKTLVRTVVSYGSKDWSLKVKCCNTLDIFELRVLRRKFLDILPNRISLIYILRKVNIPNLKTSNPICQIIFSEINIPEYISKYTNIYFSELEQLLKEQLHTESFL